MNIRTSLITNSQPTQLVQPGKGTFNNPASFPQTATVSRSSFGQQCFDTQKFQGNSVWLRIIAAITLNNLRSLSGSPSFASYWWNRLYQWKKLSNIVTIGTGKFYFKRHPVSIGYDMVLTAVFASIRGIGTRFLPPKTARTEAESTIALEKSILSASRSLLSKTWCILSHTPACCQSRSLRQQVIPEPQPISLGKCSQPIPVFNTNNIPVKAARSETAFRPGYRNLRFRLGNIGSMIFHNSSSNIGLAMSNVLVISIWLLMLSAISGNNLSFC